MIRLLVVGPGALSWREMGLAQAPSAAARDLLLGAAFAVPVLVVTLLLGDGGGTDAGIAYWDYNTDTATVGGGVGFPATNTSSITAADAAAVAAA